MGKTIHEKYHTNTKSQSKIISEKNFTYAILINVLKKINYKNEKVLDIGCGAGTMTFYLAQKAKYVTGIDISEKAIKSAKESKQKINLKNINFQQMDFPRELPKGKYDFVYFSEVIEHIKDDEIALRSIHNLLNPKGILFLTTPSRNAPLHKLGLTRKFDKKVGHIKRYSIDELLYKLANENFEVIKVYEKESLLRNFLYINPVAGKMIRFIRHFLVDIFLFFDEVLVKIFGESQIIIVAEKR